MSLKVVGAGLGRTGTMSLKLALEQLLGGTCYHMAEVFAHQEHVATWLEASNERMPDWRQFFAGYTAAVDWPVAAYWREISEAFPDAVIVLSVRDSQSWWGSVSETIFPALLRAEGPWREMIDKSFARTFTTDVQNREACIEAYERHNAQVRATADPSRLLEWTASEGWGPLCKALDLPVPAEPFPRANSKEEFLATFAKMV